MLSKVLRTNVGPFEPQRFVPLGIEWENSLVATVAKRFYPGEIFSNIGGSMVHGCMDENTMRANGDQPFDR
jgi:hypothetical protein